MKGNILFISVTKGKNYDGLYLEKLNGKTLMNEKL